MRSALGAALLTTILVVMPVAADESDALYKGKVTISNAGAAIDGGTTVLLEVNCDAFQDAGMLDASFNNAWFDSAAGASMAWMPDPSDNDEWFFFHPWDLAAGDTLSYLYMGGPDMSPPIRYIPAATGMTTADAASMELGNNFAIEQKGYIDTTYAANKRLVYKSGAFETLVSADGVITSYIGTQTTVRPTGFSDPAGGWFNEANAYDNNTGTLASTAAAAPTGYLELTRAATTTNAVDVWMSIVVGGAGSTVDLEYYDGANWHAFYSGPILDPGAWHSYSIGSYVSVSGVRIRRSAGAAGTIAVYEVRWTAVDAVVSASVASGAHTIRTEADGTDLELYVDGSLEDSFTLGAATVPDNANAWAFLVNGPLPYMEYHKLWVGGALKQHIEWEDDVTFTDLSGSGNDATPTFPTGSSDADVSATLSPMQALAPAEAPPSGTDDAAGGLAGTLPSEPDNLYDELDVDHLPGAAVINEILEAGEIPIALFWFIAIFVGIIVLCLVVYHWSKSLFAMSLVAGAGLLFASRCGIVPYWVTVPLIIIAASVLVKEKMSPL